MSTPELYLRTGYVLSSRGRIVSTREPDSSRGPLFVLARSARNCSWAVGDDVPDEVAAELDQLAAQEPPARDFRDVPVNAERYLSVLKQLIAENRDRITLKRHAEGVAFCFPESLPEAREVALIEEEALLNHHFSGWLPGEIAAGRLPVLAILAEGYPVSVCCSARRSDAAAEAGLDTVEAYRGRGLAVRVAAAWARAVRAEGLMPLYSTAWTNSASLAVARKLKLDAYASYWKVPA